MPATPRVKTDRSKRSRALFTLEAGRLLATGHFSEAAEICKRGLVHFPESLTGYIILAQAYHMLGETDRAINVIKDGYRRTGSDRLRRLALTADVVVDERQAADESEASESEVSESEASESVVSESVVSESVVDGRQSMVEEESVGGLSVEEPPVEEPPVPESPVQEPPVEEPPVHEPSIQEPPVEEPPLPEPPIQEPPVQEPPIQEPSVPEPRIQEPPVVGENAETAADVEDAFEEPVEHEDVREDVAVAEPDIPGAPPADEKDWAWRPEESFFVAVENEGHEHDTRTETAGENIEDSVVADEATTAPEIVHDAPVIAEIVPDAPVATAEIPPDAPVAEEIVPDATATTEEIVPDVPVATEEIAPDAPVIAEIVPDAPVATAEIAPDAPVAEEPLHEVQPSIDVLVADEAPVVVEDSVAEEPVATEEPIIAGPIAAETPAEPVGIVEPPIAAIDERGPERADTSATGLKMMGVRSAHSTAGTRGDAGDRARPLSLALHTGKSISRLRSSNLRLIPGLEFAPLRHEDNLRRQSIAPLINEPMPQPEVRSRAVKVAIEETALPPLPSLGDSPGTEGLPPGMRIAAEPQTSREPAERGLQTLAGPSRVPPSRPAPSRPASTPVAPPPQAAETREAVELTPLEELARRLENARIPVVEEPEPRTAFEPSIVSDTLANILVAQGAIAEAMKAFQTLARIKPERFEYYQGRIHEMKWRLQNPGGTWPPEQ